MSVVKNQTAPAIWVYEDVFDSDLFIELIENETSKDWPYISWSSSQTGDGINQSISEYRTSLEISIDNIVLDTNNPEIKKIQETFFKDIFLPIDECVIDYKTSFDLKLMRDSGYVLLKYVDGGEYHIHHDHSPNNARVLSLVASLGEADEGGELEFNHFDLTVKLKKNSFKGVKKMIFRSFYRPLKK